MEHRNNNKNDNSNKDSADKSNPRRLFLICLAVILGLSLLGILFPFFSFAAALIWPVPVVYLALKQGLRRAALMIAAAALLNGILITPVLGLITVAGFGFVGFVMSGALLEKFSPFKVLLFTVLAAVASNFMLITGIAMGMGYSFQEGIRNALLENLLPLLDNGEMSVLVQMQLDLVMRLMPGLIVISGLVSGILNYYIVHWFLRAKNMGITIYRTLDKWRFPAGYITAAIVLALLFRDQAVMLNLGVIVFFLVFLQGFGVGLFYVVKKSSSFFWRWIYVFFVIVIPLLPPFLILLGLIDLWFDIRKIEFTGSG